MQDKQKNANTYLTLRTIYECTLRRGILPSQYMQPHDKKRKGYLDWNEFNLFLTSILPREYHSHIPDVWTFLCAKWQLNYVPIDKMDSIIQKIPENDQKFDSKGQPYAKQPQPIQNQNGQAQPMPQNYQQLQPNNQQQRQPSNNQQHQPIPQLQQAQPALQQQRPQQQEAKQFQYFSPNVQNLRSPQDILNQIQSNMSKHQFSLKEVFKYFDKDNDKMLNREELYQFVVNCFGKISEQEFNGLYAFLGGREKITQMQLMKYIQDSNSLMNSVRRDGSIQDKQEIREQRNPQGQYQVPKQTANIMESNYYENPQNSGLLTSKIQFDDFVQQKDNVVGFKQFTDLYENLKAQRKLFTDPKFPPNPNSLQGNITSKVDAWKRPSEMWKNFSFFHKDDNSGRFGIGKWIGPSDIHQGELGDCYFLASVSSIACRRPDVILDLFITRKTNPYGIYAVKLNIDGDWRVVYVDDYIPTRWGKPVFTRSQHMDLWVIILEKAWAKVCGSYQKIESGVAKEVLKLLSGAPTDFYLTTDENFVSKLEECTKQRCIMVSGSCKEANKNTGLVPGHAYSVLKIKDIIHPQQGKVKLIKLRNPWADKEWIGDWSDNSPLWTPELKKELKVSKNNEGIFFMDIKQFIKNFADVQICYLKENYHYTNQQFISNKRRSIYLSINIETEGQYFFSVIQKNKRYIANVVYSPARIIVIRNKQIVASCNKHPDREIWCQGNLQKGEHLIQVKVNWQAKEEDQFNFSVYGPSKVAINQIQKVKNLIADAMLTKALAKEPKKYYEQQPNIKKCTDFSVPDGHGYFFITNQSKVTIDTTITFKELSGLKLRKPDRGQVLKVYLKPTEQSIAVFTVSEKGYGYQMQESIIFG